MLMNRAIFLIAILWPANASSAIALRSTNSSQEACSVCPDAQHSVSLPNQSFPIFGTCGALEASVNFITKDSDTCRLIQSVSSLCGCPVSPSSCFLCNENYQGPFESSRPVPYFLEAPPEINVTCDIVQAALHSLDANDQTCTLSKSLLGSYCGCTSSAGTGSSSSSGNGEQCSLCKTGQAAAFSNRTLAIGLDLPFLKTCGDLENIAKTYWQDGSETCQAVHSLGTYCGCEPTTSSSQCTFCSDGSAVPLSNETKTIPFLKNKFNFAGMVPTCGLVDAAVQSLDSTDPTCSAARLFGTYCGCPPIDRHCTYCYLPGDRVTTPDLVVREFGKVSGLDDLTCADIIWTQYQVHTRSTMCWMVSAKSYLCGCNNGQYEYLGTNTMRKKRVLAWVPRISAFLSVCGSLYIIIDVYRNHRNPLDQYHELVATMSCFDFMGSFATMFTTLPIPRQDHEGLPTGIYGALGNDATCKAQGFFVQLGYTGIFYNLALSIFYVLVINYNYRDRDLKRIRKLFHIPAVVGVGLAFAGIPFYDNFIWLCQIPSRPIIESYRYILAFVFYPIVIAILGCGVAISMVYLKVRKITQSSRRWTFAQRAGHTGGGAGMMARRVFWQSFFFVLALYGTWPLLLASEFSSTTVVKIYEHHWVWVLTLAIAPLQGFFNFFVYTRPRLMSYMRRLRRRRERRRPSVTRTGSWARRAMRRPLPVDFSDSSSSGDENKSSSPEVIPHEDGFLTENDSTQLPVDSDDTDSTHESRAKRLVSMPSLAENSFSCSKSSCSDETNSLPLDVAITKEYATISMQDSDHTLRDYDKLDEAEPPGLPERDEHNKGLIETKTGLESAADS